MKRLFNILIIFLLLNCHNAKEKYIDPTGTYDLDNTTKDLNGDTIGYFGQIQVKNLSKDKILMTFFICIGPPSYNSGSFIDTLNYRNNMAIYKGDIEIMDTSCTITFLFTKDSVVVDEKTNNYNCGCGFGHGVVACETFKKTSPKTPVLIDPREQDTIY